MMLFFLAVLTIIKLTLLSGIFWFWFWFSDDDEAFVFELFDFVPPEGSHSFFLRVRTALLLLVSLGLFLLLLLVLWSVVLPLALPFASFSSVLAPVSASVLASVLAPVSASVSASVIASVFVLMLFVVLSLPLFLGVLPFLVLCLRVLLERSSFLLDFGNWLDSLDWLGIYYLRNFDNSYFLLLHRRLDDSDWS